MNFLKDFVDKIFIIDSNQFKKYIIIFFITILSLIFLIQIFFYFQKKNIYLREKKVSDFRSKINKLIIKKELAEKNKQTIDKMLNENPSFRIKEYVLNIVKKNNLLNNSSSDFDNIRENPSKPGYKELLINIDLKNLTTKQLLTILTDMESDPKVLFKEISVNSDENEKKLNLVAVLSTIKFS